jgi:hypothetical protein
MKTTFATTVLFTSMIAMALGQKPTLGTKTQIAPFPKSCERTKELDGSDRLSEIKAISPVERVALIKAISIQLRPGSKIGNSSSEKKLLQAVMETRVTFVDLNMDGISEVIAQASDEKSCSPTGNCSFWVFMRSDNGYKLILEKGAVQTVGICTSRTNSFNDLVLRQHGSAFEQTLYIYRFANGRYGKKLCYDVRFERLVGDEVQELEEPDITRCYVANGKQQ